MSRVEVIEIQIVAIIRLAPAQRPCSVSISHKRRLVIDWNAARNARHIKGEGLGDTTAIYVLADR